MVFELEATPPALEVNASIVHDWREAARAGIDLSEEQLAAAVAFYRRARSAAPEPRARAKKSPVAKAALDDSVFD